MPGPGPGCETKFRSSPKTAREWGLWIGDPNLLTEGQLSEQRGRFAPGPRFVPIRSVRIGTGAEPPHPREPAERCELRQLALRQTPALRLNQKEICLTPQARLMALEAR
jgi:hypothetical protein